MEPASGRRGNPAVHHGQFRGRERDVRPGHLRTVLHGAGASGGLHPGPVRGVLRGRNRDAQGGGGGRHPGAADPRRGRADVPHADGHLDCRLREGGIGAAGRGRQSDGRRRARAVRRKSRAVPPARDARGRVGRGAVRRRRGHRAGRERGRGLLHRQHRFLRNGDDQRGRVGRKRRHRARRGAERHRKHPARRGRQGAGRGNRHGPLLGGHAGAGRLRGDVRRSRRDPGARKPLHRLVRNHRRAGRRVPGLRGGGLPPGTRRVRRRQRPHRNRRRLAHSEADRHPRVAGARIRRSPRGRPRRRPRTGRPGRGRRQGRRVAGRRRSRGRAVYSARAFSAAPRGE